MTTFLVATGEIEQALLDMFLEQHGSCFHSTVIKVFTTMVNSYNRTASTNLVDDVIECVKGNLSDYSPVEDIIDQFVRLVETGTDMLACILKLEYEPLNETLFVEQRPRPVPKPSIRLKEDYHHAQEQGDFYPERLRRALEELISAGI
ncbi:hypothetical protein D3C87_364110 [compost metagenome]